MMPACSRGRVAGILWHTQESPSEERGLAWASRTPIFTSGRWAAQELVRIHGIYRDVLRSATKINNLFGGGPPRAISRPARVLAGLRANSERTKSGVKFPDRRPSTKRTTKVACREMMARFSEIPITSTGVVAIPIALYESGGVIFELYRGGRSFQPAEPIRWE